ncbi:MAG: recombinase family protein [Nocardioides sp.]
MTTYGYARVSTRTQDVAGQVTQLRAAGVDHIHTETTTGAGRRPVLDDLVDQLDAGDILVVTALDRLGRVGRSLLELVDDLAGRDIGVRALHGGIDTTDPVAGRITLYVMAALAEAERALIVERTRAGLAAARAAGRRGGRPTVMTLDRLTVARQLISDGSTIAAAARTIGVSRSVLSRNL